MEITDLEIPMNMEKGLLKAKVTGKLNDGGLVLEPQFSFINKPALLTNLSIDKRVLTDVELRKPLVEGLLKRIHPIFGILATPSGLMDASLNALSWPLDPERLSDARFSTAIDVSKVQLEYSPFFQEILDCFKLAREHLVLQNSFIECYADDGRIACSPVKIDIAGSEMIIKGSQGFDESIDYDLRIPLNQKLTGEKGYSALKDTWLNVPIHGTLSKPVHDHEELAANLEELLGQVTDSATEKQLRKKLSSALQKLLEPANE